MFEFIIPDLHIGLNYDGVDYTEDVFKSLDFIYNQWVALKNPDAHIIFLGDIFDSPNVPHSYISRFISYCKKYNNLCNSVGILILKGNHDGEPDSKKGSPLLEVEASGVAEVVWEPIAVGNNAYIPYTTQDKLNDFLKSVNNLAITAYTHIDITGVTPGTEKEMTRGLSCITDVKSLSSKFKRVFAGHIHKPQQVENVTVVGSAVRCSITEMNDVKHYIRIDDQGVVSAVPLDVRNLKNYDVDYNTDEGKKLYASILNNTVGINNTDIISVRMNCPHTLAHEVDQNKFRDTVRKYCHHLRFGFDVVKEKQFRMKELDGKLSDTDIVVKFLDKQNLSDKEDVLKEALELMGE